MQPHVNPRFCTNRESTPNISSLPVIESSRRESMFSYDNSSEGLTLSSRFSPTESRRPETDSAHLQTSTSQRETSSSSLKGLPTPLKPVLKFSIERILGLSSETIPRQHLNNESLIRADPPSQDSVDEENIDVDDSRTIEDEAYTKSNIVETTEDISNAPSYQWLQCTRYHPPKLIRNKHKDGSQKKKLGRNPRVPFTQQQVVALEGKFQATHYLCSNDVVELSTSLSLTEARVKIWFQNRRARDRREKATVQRSQKGEQQKTFMPLHIPTVIWPTQASVPAVNYMQYQNSPQCLHRYHP